MKALEISKLDQHLKPVQIGGVSTGLELSTTDLRISSGELSINNLTAGTAKVDGDLTVDGNIEMTGSVSEINMAFSTQINATTSQGIVAVEASGLIIDNVNYGGDDPAFLSIYPSELNVGDAQIRLFNYTTLAWNIGNDADDSNSLKFDFSNTTTGGATKLTLTSGGDLTAAGDVIAGDDVAVAATGKLSLDGIGGHTYISESSADVLDIKVGDDLIFQITESGADGNTIDIDNACIGFTQLEPTYDATSTVVDFRHSNKQFVTFDGGNITNLQLFFPLVSGNFVLLLKQDGTGSRTITNYKVYEFDESAADGSFPVKWAGGSDPTLTTDANHVDILSFYWDADNEIAYGVSTLDFQF